ncbi:hypothetical protein [Fulvimonas soli]|uniref:dTDP-4-amino-4,6-dideoxy-D-galactose acyltransferase n=1 Tax=Fulvimonas soli TaxID=155197 RepID=A0A316HST2_9GAMM|nr:hypothetical protein [Fulvimonas soli]PWK83090.1 dTDP-4-amino-4,6-dideoxy-D-galactose acyltransferase [Fulvimonas soli]TNY26133.1 hypothetical protein BV497_10340 [Fulvimonas soli]
MSRLLERRDAAGVRAGLERAGLEPPHGFIRQVDRRYDLAVHLDHLLRPLDARDDFRIGHGKGADERWVLLERLPWDSAFFGRGVARLHACVDPRGPTPPRADTGAAVAAIGAALALAAQHGIDYVFGTVDARDLPGIRSLCASGFELIETRCHYHLALADWQGDRHPARLATPADMPSLARAARDTVNPFDRFHADPAIPPEDADRLMETWVRASIAGGFADATLVPDVASPEAFCTVRYHREHWQGWGLRLAQPVLSVVAPRHRGWYVRLIAEVNHHLRGIGAEHAFLVTQATNNAVIRSWEKLGYQYGKAEHVFRRLLR